MSLCRLCLSSEKVIASLLDASLRTKAEVCRLVEVREDDLPQSVCEACESKVNLFYDFKVQCDNTYIKLKRLFKSQNVKNEVSIKNEDENVTHIEGISFLNDRLKSESPVNSPIKIENDLTDSAESFNVDSEKKFRRKKIRKQKESKSLIRNFKSKYKSYNKHIDNGTFSQNNSNKNSETTFQTNVKRKKSLLSDISIPLKNNGSTEKGAICKNAPARPFQCELCGQTFKLKGVLKKHMLTHSIVKLFACSLCPKRYTRAEHRTVHMRTHMGIKPFVCEICAQSFVKHQDLERHKRIHSDEKKYSCKMCDKKFKRSGDVHPHMRTHTGVAPFACMYCFKAYKSRSGLRKHYSGPSCKSQRSDKKDTENPECINK